MKPTNSFYTGLGQSSTCGTIKGLARTFIIALSLVGLSACGMTQYTQTANVDTLQTNYHRIDLSCAAQVSEQQAAFAHATPSQYLALANTASFCIDGIAFSPKHPDAQLAMQFRALSFFNYMKAGDMKAASGSLQAFRRDFPQQDLYFEDYSSFVDTATALVKQHSLNSQSVKLLNINPDLQAELRRQRTWALN